MPISFKQARHIVEERARGFHPGGSERLPLLAAAGRVLASEILADRNQPPFARVTRDGFALRAADLEQLPARLRITGEVRAGAAAAVELRPGEAIAIMTGAPLPAGADAVVMVEHTRRDCDMVLVERRIDAGENFVPPGSEARAGDVVLPARTRINAAAIAVAASVGAAEVEVYRRPRVAVLATGDELVAIDEVPGPAAIRNSNSYSLAAQIATAAADPVVLPPAQDSQESLREAIRTGLACDMLLVSGGVSAGKYDFVESVLTEFGAEVFFDAVAIQPGKPTVFAQAQGKPVFGLPGNPVSTMVTFELFVRPVLAALMGELPRPLRFFEARLLHDVRTKTGLTRFLPAKLSGEFRGTSVELVPWHGSGDVVAAARADCLLVVPPDRELLSAGEAAEILLVGG